MVRLLTLRCQKTSERLNHSWKASLAVKKTSKFLPMFIKFTLCIFGEKSFALNKLSSCILVKLVNTKNWEIDSFCSNRAEDSLVSAKCWSNVLSNSFNWLKNLDIYPSRQIIELYSGNFVFNILNVSLCDGPGLKSLSCYQLLNPCNFTCCKW